MIYFSPYLRVILSSQEAINRERKKKEEEEKRKEKKEDKDEEEKKIACAKSVLPSPSTLCTLYE